MKLMNSIFALGLASLAGLACSRPPAVEEAARAGASASKGEYYCPMHTFYRSDKPGNCPICSMQLVRQRDGEESPAAGGISGHAAVAIPVDLQRRIGLATAVVERRPFARTIRASGRVEVDERRLSVVSLRYGGWIEDLRVRATGESVRPGAEILSVYSPELYEASRTYLAVRAALPEGDETVKSARERLRLWDMTEDQIRELETRGEPASSTPVLSKTAGIVTRLEAVRGKRFESGATLFEIADLSEIWIVADVHEADLALLKVGAEASIQFASSSGAPPTAGRIAFVFPTLSETTRTARARVELANPDGRLLPGEYATVSIRSDLGEQLIVDVDAVIDTGTRQLAFVETAEGVFDPREVALGARSDGKAVVLSGLAAGDKVVARATFLVDSESRLKSTLRSR
jgi:Cu(I)/Ag(I) efflux system membrane fusion protein